MSKKSYAKGLFIPRSDVTVFDDSTGIKITSIYPAYGTEGNDLNAAIKGIGFADNTKVYLVSYPSGTGEIEITQNNVKSDTEISITIPAQASGSYSIKVSKDDTYDFMENAVTFAQDQEIEIQKKKKGIIVAGGGPFMDNDLWLVTEKLSNLAYSALFTQGYTNETIYYLNSRPFIDATGNGMNDADAEASLNSLEYALKTWAADSENPTSELVLYMTGSGSDQGFEIKSGKSPEILTTQVLNNWITEAQKNIPGKIIVIYDACQSGSVLTPIADSERIIITGTSKDEPAWFLDDGEISFSWFFWNSIFNNAKIYESFIYSKNMMNLLQNPQINENGKLVINKKRETIEDFALGREREILTNPPVIGDVSPEQILQDTEIADIWAKNIIAENSISQVWAKIVPPFLKYRIKDISVLVVPSLKLLDTNNDGQYNGTYDKFTWNGEYGIFIYALDKIGLQSLFMPTKVTQPAGILIEIGDINLDGALNLKDAVIALQIAAGMNNIDVKVELEASGDSRIGLKDAVFVLQNVAGLNHD
ncbi:C13 family peptidase [Desulfobacterales bacterium HSG17]|nr:C13 family peptidase [Desulfobacterales bacterium HSG17]